VSDATTDRGRAGEAIRIVAGFCEEVLDVDQVDCHLSLLELGGNSLAATMVANRIELSWGFRPSMEDLLTLPLEDLAAACEAVRP
jgi:hypothetical protein